MQGGCKIGEDISFWPRDRGCPTTQYEPSRHTCAAPGQVQV